MASTDAAAPELAGDAPRRATAFAVMILSLLLVQKVTDILGLHPGPVTASLWFQALFFVGLCVVPVLYAFPGARGLLARHRWTVLAVQGVLTWAPLALFGRSWQPGGAGLLAGLVLLSVPGRVSWLLAGMVLAAEVGVRAVVTGLPWAPAWSGALWVVVATVDDGVVVFAMIRLAQVVRELHQARSRAAELSAATERLHAAEALQSAVGEHLSDIAATVAAAVRSLPVDPARARGQIAAAGQAAREAVARVRAVAAGHRPRPQPRPRTPAPDRAVIGARLSWAVLVVLLCGYGAQGLNDAFVPYIGPRLTTFLAAGTIVVMVLQLRHSRMALDGGRRRAWQLTLGLQAAVAFAFFLPPLRTYFVLAGFVAGSVLLLVPGRWRWAGYAAVVLGWTALYATVPLHGYTASDRDAIITLYVGISVAYSGLLVYGLCWLANTGRQLEALRGELAEMAGLQERLRVARDVHDLLGLGLSAVALKADLVARLIGRDDDRAAAEIEQMSRICAAARADMRQVTAGYQWLSLEVELAAASQILASAGIEVRVTAPDGPLPAVADDVLAPVLREAVTNILRHSSATTCTIEMTARDGALRLAVGNDGATAQIAMPGGAGEPAVNSRPGSGLANLTDRVRAADGWLVSGQVGDWFELIAEIPLPGQPCIDDPVTARTPRVALKS
jgi:two-component system sensor histidine kinase DesK